MYLSSPEDELTEPETEKPHKVSRGDGERHEEPSKTKAERLYEEAVARGEMYQSRLRKLGKRKERDSHSHTHSHSNSNGVNGITDYDDEGEGEGEYDDAYSESSSISASIRTDSTSPSYLDSHSGRKRARTRHRISGSGSPTRMHTMNGIRKPRPRKRGHGSGATFVTRTDDELARRLRENQALTEHAGHRGVSLVFGGDMLGRRAGGKGVGIPPVSLGLSSSSSFFTSSTSFPSSSTSISCVIFLDVPPIIPPSFLPNPRQHRHLHSPSPHYIQPRLSPPPTRFGYLLNPSSDATAIWVQTKFGVPESGWWRTSASTRHGRRTGWGRYLRDSVGSTSGDE
ncbi:hypothetical protein BT96DRAFT_722294 [Gymnopus androsaceus JB14]|uniref:Uncharacterized protein n=1 Tax=Gymnopus androsaceus JB14 TaxID=1447944 RepID=A0A6A4HM85_9AGAR|nr:hypothetical protein BT96DRAFT_722294 [Gymnopus androsaceus JB14]